MNDRRKVLRKKPQKRASVHVPPALVLGGFGTIGLEPNPNGIVALGHGGEATLAVDDVADGGGGGSGVLGYVRILLTRLPPLDDGNHRLRVHPAMGLPLLLLVHQRWCAEVHSPRVLVQQHADAFHCVRYVESEHDF
jgi:hypothetical protein